MSAPATSVASGSDRLRLAALAVEAATGVDGVLAPDAGPRLRHQTVSGVTRVSGAAVNAHAGGRYGVELGLRGALIPLRPVGDTVRAAVTRSISEAGLGHVLAQVDITFHDVGDPDADAIEAPPAGDAVRAGTAGPR